MREKLLHDVARELNGYEIPVSVKQEILQNTMDRYDDFISQGYTEDDAYFFAKESVGDLNEVEKAELASKPSMKRLIYTCIAAIFVIMAVIYVLMRLFTFTPTRGVNGFGSGPAISSQAVEITSNGAVTYSADDTDKICIDWASGNVYIGVGDCEEIEFFENSKAGKKPMTYDISGRTLNIHFCENGANVLNFNLSKDLTVVIPADWENGEIRVSTASANVSVSDLQGLKELEYDGASGKLEVRNVQCQKLDADAASGSVNLTNCDIGDLDADTASGSVEVAASALGKAKANTASGKVVLDIISYPERLDIDTASGAVEVWMAADAGYTVEFDTASGKFKSNVDFEKNGEKYTHRGSCNVEISADTASGSLTVNVG